MDCTAYELHLGKAAVSQRKRLGRVTLNQVQWRVPADSAIQEAETGGSLSPGVQGQHGQSSKIAPQTSKTRLKPLSSSWLYLKLKLTAPLFPNFKITRSVLSSPPLSPFLFLPSFLPPSLSPFLLLPECSEMVPGWTHSQSILRL